MPSTELSDRVAELERRVRHLTLGATVASLVVTAISTSAWVTHSQTDVLRARALIIVDGSGTERIVIGAPIPEPAGRRIGQVTGMAINDSAGAERFGVGVSENGDVVMGFDAPPRTDNSSTRERINIGVNSDGRGQMRFLDTRGIVRAHMSLFDDDNVRLFFTDYQQDRTLVHRVDARGDSVITHVN